MRLGALLVLLHFVLALNAEAQVIPVGDLVERAWRLEELRGERPLTPALMIRPLAPVSGADSLGGRQSSLLGPSRKVRFVEAGLWVPTSRTSFNSGRPYGPNLGATWQGAGATQTVTGGAWVKVGPVSASVQPTLFHTRNADHTVFGYVSTARGNARSLVERGRAPSHTYGAVYFGIDLPERMGAFPYSKFDWGQTYVRADLGPFVVGAGIQNQWLGPGNRYTMLFTNNGPGFPQVFAGTGRPVRTPLGQMHFNWFFGEVVQSPYFTLQVLDSVRYLTGASFALNPAHFPGLTVGIGRTISGFYLDNFRRVDYLQALGWPSNELSSGEDDDQRDQMGTTFFRWVFPRDQFEVYGEFGLGDFRQIDGDLGARDFLVHPDHQRGFVLGMTKLNRLTARRDLRIGVELASLEGTKTEVIRGHRSMYSHGRVAQGHTHRGKALGAAIGPGSSSQRIELDVLEGNNEVGFFAERMVLHNDVVYFMRNRLTFYNSHYVTTLFGARALRDTRWARVGVELSRSSALNFDFTYQKDGYSNWYLSVFVQPRYPFVRRGTTP